MLKPLKELQHDEMQTKRYKIRQTDKTKQRGILKEFNMSLETINKHTIDNKTYNKTRDSRYLTFISKQNMWKMNLLSSLSSLGVPVQSIACLSFLKFKYYPKRGWEDWGLSRISASDFPLEQLSSSYWWRNIPETFLNKRFSKWSYTAALSSPS